MNSKMHSSCTNCSVGLPEYIASNPTADRRYLLGRIAVNLYCLHNVDHVVHGDVKMRKIIVSSCGIPRLAESSKAVPATEQPRAPTGTDDRLPMTTATDVYAFGWLIFHVLTDIDPFEMVRDPNIMKLIASGVKPNRPAPSTLPWKRGLDDELWKLCLRCWEISPTQRPTMVEVLQVFYLPVSPGRDFLNVKSKFDDSSEAQNSVAIQTSDAGQRDAPSAVLRTTKTAEASLTLKGHSQYTITTLIMTTESIVAAVDLDDATSSRSMAHFIFVAYP